MEPCGVPCGENAALDLSRRQILSLAAAVPVNVVLVDGDVAQVAGAVVGVATGPSF